MLVPRFVMDEGVSASARELLPIFGFCLYVARCLIFGDHSSDSDFSCTADFRHVVSLNAKVCASSLSDGIDHFLRRHQSRDRLGSDWAQPSRARRELIP